MLKFFIRNWMAGIVSLAWWLSLAGLLDAQGSTREVNFRVLCIQHSQEATTAHAVEAGSGAVIEIPLLTGRMSQPFKGAFSNNTASLFVENEAAAGGRQVIAEGKLASGPQQLFFLVPVPPESKLIYRIIALNDDVATFPMGAVRVLNLCTVPIRLNFAGANMAAIAPGGTATYPPVKAVDEWNMYQVRIHYQLDGKNWTAVSSQSWKSSDRKRDFVITTFDTRTKRPKIYHFKDLPPSQVTDPD